MTDTQRRDEAYAPQGSRAGDEGERPSYETGGLRLALLVGWLVFLIPVTIVVAFWLPRRIRFYRQARASQVFLDALADLDLFALRAMAAQPHYVLAEISDDPVKAWRSGDRAVINQLAELELRRNGLQLPDTLRAVSSEASIG